MSILSHGSDMTLAPTIASIVKHTAQTVASSLELLVRLGFETIQLDATLSGTRPRQLDRRARRDLLALLGRSSVRLAGLDLTIPRRHFIEPEHQDRATAATVATIELAADLGRVPVSIALPVVDTPDDIKVALVEAADGRGVSLAVHAEDQLDALARWIEQVDLPALGIGIDPAAVLSARGDPAVVTQRLAKHLRVARLSDLAGGIRRHPGEGDLDTVSYRVAVDLAGGRLGPVVLDLRSVEDPLQCAVRGKAAWDNAAFESR